MGLVLESLGIVVAALITGALLVFVAFGFLRHLE
jgi:hypothetical protein